LDERFETMDNNNDEKRNEITIREFAESLKKLKTPEGLRDSNRRYIRDALNTMSAEKDKTPGWLSKRISVPFPVAAGFLMLFCLQLALALFNLGDRFRTSEPPIPDKTDSTGLLEEPAEPQYSERDVYVAGMGFVENVKDYAYFKEKDHESN
jgi:hypothetical protein